MTRIPWVVIVLFAAQHSETAQRLLNVAVFRSASVSTDADMPLRTDSPGFVWIHRDFQCRNHNDLSEHPDASRYDIWHGNVAAQPSMPMGNALACYLLHVRTFPAFSSECKDYV